MNKDVVNEIFKRRPARDFLRLYPSEKWKEIIPDIFEIGVLNLKNSFGTLKFSKNQIKDILIDLRNYKPDTYINNNNDNDTEEINTDNNNEQNNEEEYENNEEEEEYFDNNNINNNININNNNIIKKEEIKERTANAEVFIPDENIIVQKKVNYNRPKIAYNSTMEEIREKNIENKRNLGYTESKIKYQIMNDKRNHQKKKRKLSNDNDNEENFSFNQNKNKIRKEKNMNKNYVINFDKNLNPQKPIEIQKNYLNNNFNEENIFNNFNIDNNNDNNDNDYFNINNNINNNQNIQNHLNNYKINMLNFPKQDFYSGNFNNN